MQRWVQWLHKEYWWKLYNGDYSLYNTHKTMGKIVNAGYFTGAALSLFSPPPLTNKKTKGFSFN